MNSFAIYLAKTTQRRRQDLVALDARPAENSRCGLRAHAVDTSRFQPAILRVRRAAPVRKAPS